MLPDDNLVDMGNGRSIYPNFRTPDVSTAMIPMGNRDLLILRSPVWVQCQRQICFQHRTL